jgi:hypothetical protein
MGFMVNKAILRNLQGFESLSLNYLADTKGMAQAGTNGPYGK